jgi:hypothetical protein
MVKPTMDLVIPEAVPVKVGLARFACKFRDGCVAVKTAFTAKLSLTYGFRFVIYGGTETVC